MTLELEVWRFDQHCVFQLSWGQGQQHSATLPYPESLTARYQAWQQSYFNFYRRLALNGQVGAQTAECGLRGQVAAVGSLSSLEDWRFQLVQAEASLLSEFHRWLNSAQLVKIRQQIAQVARSQSEQAMDIFLTCSPIELERLPWEAWEIGTEFASTTTIRIVRTPGNIQAETAQRPRRGRPRILVILGDDTGLNFQADREAVRSLSRVAEIKFIGWKPGQDLTELPTHIAAAITDEQGWDVLFFAGHSNETAIVGGELAIAPNTSIAVREIAEPLKIAKNRGLQFALFNSCNGLNIATSLIDLGLSQVVVMREPIHNQVAQEFLVQFLRGLAEHKDVHESLLSACRFLKTERNLTHPSADLVPSLFRHPGAKLFRISPIGFREQLKQWLPTRKQGIALSALALLSLLLPVQRVLLEQRLLMQAIYRQATGQGLAATPSPVLLVQIDEKSIRDAGISVPRPMDRTYLAKLVEKLSALDARVVGIDYLLDRPQGRSDQVLAKSIRAAIAHRQETRFVFVTKQDNGGWLKALPEIASSNWSLHGDMEILGESGEYMKLLPTGSSDPQSLPFSSLMALAHQSNIRMLSNSPQPQSQKDFLSQLLNDFNAMGQNYTSTFSARASQQPMTVISYFFNQMWLHPILDFSVPPSQVYQPIPAWELLQRSANAPQLRQLKQQAVIIAAGGYGEAGVAQDGQDNFPLPAAIGYWRIWETPPNLRQQWTGGEVHSYMFHHLLNRRLVVPIPDLWMIGVAALLAQGTVLALRQRLHRRLGWVILLTSITATYGLVSLQIYYSSAVLLPWLLPSITVWTYTLLALRGKTYG